jgi:hypothetical protein
MKLTGRAYDILNVIVQIILPSIGTLYFALSGIWGFPDAQKVVGSIVAIDTFLGLVQAWFKSNWKPETHGTVLINNSGPPGTVGLKFQLDAPLEDIQPGKKFLLGVEETKSPGG